jgi:hypothetical protein
VVLHSVPPLVVFVAAEVVTHLRDKLTDAVAVAFMNATEQASVHEPAALAPMAPRSAPPARRKLFADYLTDAQDVWTPGMEITPAWVREVTGCSRGLSSRLAAALTAETGKGVQGDD